MMIIDNKFNIGDIVYLTTDIEQLPRVVISFTVSANGIIYNLTQGINESTHYNFEMSKEKDLLTVFNN